MWYKFIAVSEEHATISRADDTNNEGNRRQSLKPRKTKHSYFRPNACTSNDLETKVKLLNYKWTPPHFSVVNTRTVCIFEMRPSAYNSDKRHPQYSILHWLRPIPSHLVCIRNKVGHYAKQKVKVHCK